MYCVCDCSNGVFSRPAVTEPKIGSGGWESFSVINGVWVYGPGTLPPEAQKLKTNYNSVCKVSAINRIKTNIDACSCVQTDNIVGRQNDGSY